MDLRLYIGIDVVPMQPPHSQGTRRQFDVASSIEATEQAGTKPVQLFEMLFSTSGIRTVAIWKLMHGVE